MNGSPGARRTWMPAAAALAGVGLAALAGVVACDDLGRAADALWRPLLTIFGVMATTASAAELGVFARIAAIIEPRTRGPVRHAFRLVYVMAAVTAALLSNDAAILLVTPVVLELLRAVYPRRNPKFLVPFAFAVFVAAGVAPLPTGNPMNLVLAERAGIDWNTYVLHMFPVAVVAGVVSYLMLAWWFRDALADEAPAIGEAPEVRALGPHARVVFAIAIASLVSYPVLAALGAPLWTVAAPAGLASAATARAAGIRWRRVAGGISWELVPFLYGVFVLALALGHAGLIEHLAALYAHSHRPLLTVGCVAALGSAALNNHPMALLHSLALAHSPPRLVFAALVGGDLGPRLLPHGSLAGLLWLDALRRDGIALRMREFVQIGCIVTIPALAAALLALWLAC